MQRAGRQSKTGVCNVSPHQGLFGSHNLQQATQTVVPKFHDFERTRSDLFYYEMSELLAVTVLRSPQISELIKNLYFLCEFSFVQF